MPNWCSTGYYVTTKGFTESERKRLYPTLLKFLTDVTIATSTDSGTDFGRGWLGQVYIQAGYKFNSSGDREWDEEWIECRGEVLDVQVDTGDDNEIVGVALWCETAWQPMIESFQRLVDEKYPGLKLVCCAEEPGCEIYINTDTAGYRFLDKYVIATDEDNYYCETDEELLRYLEELTGKRFKDVSEAMSTDLEKLYREYKGDDLDEDDEAYLSVHEFECEY